MDRVMKRRVEDEHVRRLDHGWLTYQSGPGTSLETAVHDADVAAERLNTFLSPGEVTSIKFIKKWGWAFGFRKNVGPPSWKWPKGHLRRGSIGIGWRMTAYQVYAFKVKK